MIDVSVVVPTYQRPELLGQCLFALMRQSLGHDRYEVIVADDAASPVTRAQVDRLAGRAGAMIRYVPVTGESHGPAAARNVGWRTASAPIVAFTDDDTVPTRDWLKRGLQYFGHDGIAAVSGRTLVPLGPSPTDYERDTAGLETGGFVTANCLVRRDALKALGGFDERFALAWREDTDLYFRLLKEGCNVAHAPASVVVHPVRLAMWGVSILQQRKASYDALLYKKHPALYSQYVRPGRPLVYYPIVASLLAMILGVVSGEAMVTALAAVAWLIFTSCLVARRLRGNSMAPSHVLEMLVTSALIPPLSLFWRMRGAVRHHVLFW
jgi:GT2 family glycosyltransferase